MNPENQLASGRILLVDDDAVLRAMAGQTIQRAGFELAEVASGEEAIERAPEFHPDLVLLDIVMPGIDGFEVCRRLRAGDVGKNLAIMMLTGLDDTESIERAYQCGADDFITKPINWNLLIHRVRFNLRAASARAALAASRGSLDSAQRLARMGSWEWSPRDGRFSFSEQFALLLRLPPDQLRNTHPAALIEQVAPEDREALETARERALTRGGSYQLRYCCRDGEGNVLTLEETGRAISNGRGPRLEAIVQDVSQAVANEERMRFLSYHDITTGLPSRQFFLEVANHTLEQARRTSTGCALLFIDLDHFKEINVQLGSDAGDAMLKTIAFRIVECVRSATSAGLVHTPEGIEVAARAGGDQFLVLLSRLRRETDASQLADRLLDAIRQPVRIGHEDSIITASIGLTLFPRDGGDIATLLENAEQTCRTAQKRGRDVHAFYSEDVGQVASARLRLENEIRRALSQNEFVLHYQPKVDLVSGRLAGAEALVRWQHPERGLLYPGDFIPLAEESGLILALGHRVLALACDQIAAWRAGGLLADGQTIAINLSALSFTEEDLLVRLVAATRSRGIPSGSLGLEVTETSLMHQTEVAVARLTALRGAGFLLALDDFGTGYSSLGYLKRFPVDQIKIDRSFVADLANEVHGEAIVAAIVSLACRLGLEVVAEGVETSEQMACLVAMGCRYAQGYYISRPGPAEALEPWLRRPLP